jgi:hypothetical protein
MDAKLGLKGHAPVFLGTMNPLTPVDQIDVNCIGTAGHQPLVERLLRGRPAQPPSGGSPGRVNSMNAFTRPAGSPFV